MQMICHLEDIEEGLAKAFVMNGTSIFGVKKEGQLYFYKNACPHLGIELEWQEDDFLEDSGDLIRCNTHGALFTIEKGLCISGPCQNDSLQPIPTTVKEGKVYTEMTLYPWDSN